MTGKLSFQGVGIGTLSKILAVNGNSFSSLSLIMSEPMQQPKLRQKRHSIIRKSNSFCGAKGEGTALRVY